jgi:hypothetical protein
MNPHPAPRRAVEETSGPPGARWFVGIFFLFALVVLTGMFEGWWDYRGSTVAGPATPHHSTSGAANRAQEPR